MSNFSTDSFKNGYVPPVIVQDFYANIDTIAFSLQRIADALDKIAGFDTND